MSQIFPGRWNPDFCCKVRFFKKYVYTIIHIYLELSMLKWVFGTKNFPVQIRIFCQFPGFSISFPIISLVDCYGVELPVQACLNKFPVFSIVNSESFIFFTFCFYTYKMVSENLTSLVLTRGKWSIFLVFKVKVLVLTTTLFFSEISIYL